MATPNETPSNETPSNETPSGEGTSFTGRTRRRTTRRGVVVADRAARALISVGGVGTLLAVLAVAFFLLWVALPLFFPADIDLVESSSTWWDEEPHHLGVDELRRLGWVLLPSGRAVVFRLDTGEVVESRELFPGAELTAASFSRRETDAVFGFADGTVRTATVELAATVLPLGRLGDDVRRSLEDAPPGTLVIDGNAVVERTPTGQARRLALDVSLDVPTVVAEAPIRRLAHTRRTRGSVIVALAETAPGETASGEAPVRLLAVFGEEKSDFLTGTTRTVLAPPIELPFEPPFDPPSGPSGGASLPRFLKVNGTGGEVLVAWESGELLRVHTGGNGSDAFIAERGRLVPEGVRLTSFTFLLGNDTLVWGDDRGEVRGGFLLRLADYEGPGIEGLRLAPEATERLVATKDLGRGPAAAILLASSARTRLLFAGFADGTLRLLNVTNETELAEVRLDASAPLTELVMTPKDDGLVALVGSGEATRLYGAGFDPGHPEASFKALFRPVWYEGYDAPAHIWQSSGGSDDFEPKLGLVPLIFGTLKATLYSMLFGAPLALLAAIFTSEFLPGRARSVIKPSIELMASLPSVVLGFLAALVFAPFVESVLPTVLLMMLTVPLAFVAGAHLWQLLPGETGVRLERFRFGLIALTLPAGLIVALPFGPWIEKALFGGDLRAWLAWNPGSADAERFAGATGGWLILWTPLMLLVAAVVSSRLVHPLLRSRGAKWSRRRLAAIDGLRFFIGLAVVAGAAYFVSASLAALGFDPRGSYIDTYVQRNAFIVGVAMGFAIIPIIYTIAEDALSTVPEHLRSASLGAGATPWQTAVRIVVPMAMSGLFSALMVGLGRAVGETMIVLMAAGNTPILEWNIFNGFRTLSANIAVELPEAVRGSTHYRTLFLAALVLFLLTFLVNTVAEVIRQRFRKKAHQL